MIGLSCALDVVLDLFLVSQDPAQWRQEPRHDIPLARTGSYAVSKIALHNRNSERRGKAPLICFAVIGPANQDFEKFLHLKRGAIPFNRMDLLFCVVPLKVVDSGGYRHLLAWPDILVNAI